MKKHNDQPAPIWFAQKGGNHARGPFRVYAYRPASYGERQALNTTVVLVVVRDAWTSQREAEQAAQRLNRLPDQRLALRQAAPCYTSAEAADVILYRGTLAVAWTELGEALDDVGLALRETRLGRFLSARGFWLLPVLSAAGALAGLAWIIVSYFTK